MNPTPSDPTSGWQDPLREHLLPLAEALEQRTRRFLSTQATASPERRSDADRLHSASLELLQTTTALQELTPESPAMGGIPEDPDTLLRASRHELLNILNRVVGYSHLLLELEDDSSTGVDRVVLESLRDLARECQTVILQHFGTRRSGSTPGRPVAESGSRCDLSHILVVEADDASRKGLVRTLRLLGHMPSEAIDGDQAIASLLSNSFDLVLLDIRLPGRDGYEVLRTLRQDLRLHSLPVLMMCALDQVTHTVRSIEAGADDLLPKPIDHVLLRTRVTSLLSRRQLRIRQLEQFFPPEVARQLLDRPELLDKGMETDISVLFCDIRGFSRVSRKLGPAGTIEWVSAVMEELTECIVHHEGVLVDFIGDELLAMWGAPTHQPDHALRACRTALEILDLLPALNDRWQAGIGEPMAFGIGIHSGPAWVGNAGTRRKFKYGPSGDTVNVGSRVQGAARYMAAPLVISRQTHDHVAGKVLSRRLGRVRVVNIAEPVELFQIVADEESDWDQHRGEYERALGLFEQRRLQEAARLLGGLIAQHGASGPHLALLARTIEGILAPEKWSEVFELPGK